MTEEDKMEAADPKKNRSEERILSFLGLATKAQKTVSGTDAVLEAIFRERACLVLVAGDSSEGTAEKISFHAGQAGVPYCRFSTRENLGKFLGKTDRAVACVTDEGFAARLVELLKDGCYEVKNA